MECEILPWDYILPLYYIFKQSLNCKNHYQTTLKYLVEISSADHTDSLLFELLELWFVLFGVYVVACQDYFWELAEGLGSEQGVQAAFAEAAEGKIYLRAWRQVRDELRESARWKIVLFEVHLERRTDFYGPFEEVNKRVFRQVAVAEVESSRVFVSLVFSELAHWIWSWPQLRWVDYFHLWTGGRQNGCFELSAGLLSLHEAEIWANARQ